MLDLFLLTLAVALGGNGGATSAETGATAAVAPASQTATASAPLLVAEPQVVMGRFTTATEVRPILTATRMNWVAVREFNGQDLLYVTQLMSWRCGLLQLRWGVNGEPLKVWDLPPCHEDSAAPNALTESDGLPYVSYPLGSIDTVEIEITYDDLGTDSATFARKVVLMP